MEPITNEEIYLSALAGESVSLPDPITRKDVFLAAAAGMAVSVPDPITREEMYLSQIKPGDGSGVVIRNQNKTITENGAYKADSGYTGLGTVTVAVPIPEAEDPILTDITITENGEYTPEECVDGFNRVTVEVETACGESEALTLVYETEFSVAESINTSTETTLATLETEFAETDYDDGALYIVVIKCVNDTETDMSFSHFQERVQTLLTSDGGYPTASLQSGVIYFYNASSETATAYGGAKGGVYVSGAAKWMAKIYVKTFGSSNSGGFAASGDYSLKLYKVDTGFFGLEGLV